MISRRKLAAILFTDIVGYTKQSSLDETRSLMQRERVERLIKDCAVPYNGRVIKTIGDAVMLEFGSAVEAVSCALTIQEQMQTLDTGEMFEDPVQVRIGVHVGDVVEEDNDLYGNAVNIAQRIQDMAQPGGICISREVYVQIRPILKLRCDVVTTPSRKPMPEPVEVLNVTSDLLADTSASRSSASVAPLLFKALLIPLFVFIWMLIMPLWNYGAWGVAASGALLGILVITLCRRLTRDIPLLRANEVYSRKGRAARLAALAPLLLFFVFSAFFISTVYVGVIDNASFQGWGSNTAPWNYNERHKGEEYRLLNRLTTFQEKFQENPPKVSLDLGAGGRWNSSDRLPFLSLSIPALLGFLLLYIGVAGALATGQDKNYWKQTPLANRKWITNSLGMSFGLVGMLFLLWMWRDMIFTFSGLRDWVGATIRCHTDVDTVTGRLETWFKEHGYEVPAYQKYVLNTVPQEKRIGQVVVYRAWKPDMNDRWHFGLRGVELRAPFLYVECLASDHPAETIVTVGDRVFKRESPEYVRMKADLDSLAALFADVREPGKAQP